jgi:hypothetical protein
VWLGCSLVFWAACAPRIALPYSQTVQTAAGPFRIDFGTDDAQAAGVVTDAVDRAATTLQRWGTLREPVTLVLLPSHQALEDALARHGYPWLRAWARYDEVLLQSPRTWGEDPSPADVRELVLHELTHCLMYQLSSDRAHWEDQDTPLWFREGMAAVTANQGLRWMALPELAALYAQHPEEDLVARPGDPYEPRTELWHRLLTRIGLLEPDRYTEIYAAAYHAFVFLDQRKGDEGIRALLARLRGGDRFDQAFSTAMGTTPDAFAADFRRYVLSSGAPAVQPP